MKKTIYFDEEIQSDSLQNLIKTIGDLSMIETLEIKINSSGGLTGVAQQIVEYLQNLKAKGIKIITNALAYCDSSAILIFGVGDERIIDKYNESFLIHEPTAGIDNAKIDDAVSFLDYIVKIRENIIDSYENLFGVPKEVSSLLISQERSLTPQKCLELGFATKIGRTANSKKVFLAVNQSAKSLEVSQIEIDSVRKLYFDSINMTYSEFVKWSDSDCSKKVIDKRPIARTKELLNDRNWNEKHYRWALQSIDFVKNFTKEQPPDEQIIFGCNMPKKQIILKNWGVDMAKQKNNQSKGLSYKDFNEVNFGFFRFQLPQVESPNKVADIFEKALGSQGVLYCEIPASQLKPILLSVDEQIVSEIIKNQSFKEKVYIISEDNFIIDGHHNWAACLDFDKDFLCNCIKIDLDVFSILFVLKN